MQIRQCYESQWGMFMNTNDAMLVGHVNAGYTDADVR